MDNNFSRVMNGRINSIVGVGLQHVHELNSEGKKIGVVALGAKVAEQLEDDKVFCYHVLRAYIDTRSDLQAVKGRHGGIKLKPATIPPPPASSAPSMNLMSDVAVEPAKASETKIKRKRGRPRIHPKKIVKARKAKTEKSS